MIKKQKQKQLEERGEPGACSSGVFSPEAPSLDALGLAPTPFWTERGTLLRTDTLCTWHPCLHVVAYRSLSHTCYTSHSCKMME